jgi:hypothetical protein
VQVWARALSEAQSELQQKKQKRKQQKKIGQIQASQATASKRYENAKQVIASGMLFEFLQQVKK